MQIGILKVNKSHGNKQKCIRVIRNVWKVAVLKYSGQGRPHRDAI